MTQYQIGLLAGFCFCIGIAVGAWIASGFTAEAKAWRRYKRRQRYMAKQSRYGL